MFEKTGKEVGGKRNRSWSLRVQRENIKERKRVRERAITLEVGSLNVLKCLLVMNQ